MQQVEQRPSHDQTVEHAGEECIEHSCPAESSKRRMNLMHRVDKSFLALLPNPKLEHRNRDPKYKQGEKIRHKERPPAVLEAEVWKAPHIARANRRAHRRQDE